MKYAFIKAHSPMFFIRSMCRIPRVHPSGFYAWLRQPLCKRAVDDKRQTSLIRTPWEESAKVDGYPKLHDDLCDQGESASPNRFARLAKLVGIRAQIGYKRRPGKYVGKLSVIINNTLNRQFDVAVVIDLYSRRVVGWSMQSRQMTELVLLALLMAVWRRKPANKVMIHSDQGSQFTIIE